MIAAPEINVYKTPNEKKKKKKLIFKYYFLFELCVDTVDFMFFNFTFVLLLSFEENHK